MPTTIYKEVFRPTYATTIRENFIPQYTTTVVTENIILAHTDLKIQVETVPGVTQVTNTEVVPSYSTVVSTSYITVTTPEFKYETVHSVLPNVVRTTVVATTTVIREQIVPKYYTETLQIPNLITVCPQQQQSGQAVLGQPQTPQQNIQPINQLYNY